LPRPDDNNKETKDERWAIKIFRPLLKLLDIQNIPIPPEIREIHLFDKREWILQGMGKCTIVIEQRDLPKKIGGLLITSHNIIGNHNYFKLNIIIASRLCNRRNHRGRSFQKLTAIHEFTHAVATLSAISRVQSNELIERLKEIFRKKTHVLYIRDLARLAAEISKRSWIPFFLQRNSIRKRIFSDQHFRLGFEDFPVSYPIIFEEFLFSKEMFEEFFSQEQIDEICRLWYERNTRQFRAIVNPIVNRICHDKALYKNFVKRRFFQILFKNYFSNYCINRFING
jgi:hypothetical protein